MEFNRITLGIGLLILLAIGFVYVWKPDLSPTALISGSLPTYNPFLGPVTQSIEKMFRDKPQAVVEQSGRVGLLFPSGNSVQFAKDGKTTEQDVVVILNASTTTLTNFHMYPEFVQNEFTYVPAEQLQSENPYVRAQYPNGYYLMPVNVDG